MLKKLKEYLKNIPISRLESILFCFFSLSLILFIFGQVFKVIMPIICLPILLLLYYRDWQNRNLKKLPIWWLVLILFATIFLQVAFSKYFSVSFNTVRPNIFRGFVLFFVGLECIRSYKDLRNIIFVLVSACLIEGLNGVYQFAYGADFITNTKPLAYINFTQNYEELKGSLAALKQYRLTGAMSTYRVGDYIALIGLPACALFVILPFNNYIMRLWLSILTLSPAIFLWIGAQSRSSFLAVLGGLYFAWILLTRPNLKKIIILPSLSLLLLFSGIKRISLTEILKDERFLIWDYALKCFNESPIFGTGAGTFVQACTALNMPTLPNGHSVPLHPHNVYLQFLVDGGIIGFSLMMLAFGGILVWSILQIKRGLTCENEKTKAFWRITVFLGVGYIGYLIDALAAHGFYRTWFVSTSFSIIGLLLGACVVGNKLKKDAPCPE